MSDRIATFSELIKENLLEVGAGRPRTVNTGQYPPLAILRVADVLDGAIVPSIQSYSVDAGRKATEPKISRPGDVVLTVKGTVGRVAIMPQEGPDFAYSPQLCYFRPAAAGPLSPRYLYYWFKSAEFWRQADSVKGQTDMADYISLTDIESLRMRIPSLHEQSSIADVLGALDDKIAVNERIVETSDRLLRDIYQDERFSLEKSITLGRLGMIVREGVPVESLSGDENYIGLEHVPRRNMWLTAWGRSAEVASAKSAFREGDVLFGKLRPYFHKVGLALTDGICSTDILVVRPTNRAYLGWLLLALSSDEVVAHASAVGDGTRMPRAKWSDLSSFEVPWPGEKTAERVHATVCGIAERVKIAAAESHALAALRDTLLPQIMSGRIRVKDAEKVVEENT